MSKYYVGDVGTEVLVETGSEVDTATVTTLLVKKPSGEEVEWVASLGPPNINGKYTTLSYIVQEGDWDEAGFWTLQAYVEMPSWKGRGESVKFKLEGEFK